MAIRQKRKSFLIHAGIDTVKMEGSFETFAEAGTKVKQEIRSLRLI
ncbi:MAG: PTS glucose transporter subunit IIA [Blautia marasmi]